MKGYIVFAVVLLGVLGYAHALPMSSDDADNKIWPIPQVDGTIRWMTRGEAIADAVQTEQQDLRSAKFDKVCFFLFTHVNPTEPIELDMEDPETLARSTFDSRNPTRFMIHGWGSGHEDPGNRKIRGALFENGEDIKFNFIVVDWSVYGGSINYALSQSRCSKAGKVIAEFIDWLHDSARLSFDTLAVYGHSLGAHVAGFTGKHVQRGRVHTIVGLDPAMPLFAYNKPDSRLADTDAEYVETIQTNGGLLGFYNPIGQAAFYPNGGKSQPGCGLDLEGACAHSRSVDYFTEALSHRDGNGFHAIGCSEFEHVKAGSCNLYSADGVRLGDPNNAGRAKGIYYLETNSESPFALGNVYN